MLLSDIQSFRDAFRALLLPSKPPPTSALPSPHLLLLPHLRIIDTPVPYVLLGAPATIASLTIPGLVILSLLTKQLPGLSSSSLPSPKLDRVTGSLVLKLLLRSVDAP